MEYVDFTYGDLDYRIFNNGKIISKRFNHTLKTRMNKDGYIMVTLGKTKRTSFLVHRLVATYFIPNPNNLPEVNHKDKKRDNNDVDNLEWCTREYNIKHSIENIRKTMIHRSTGENNVKAKMSEKDVIEIRDLYDNKIFTIQEITDIYDSSWSTINNIVKRLTWKHI